MSTLASVLWVYFIDPAEKIKRVPGVYFPLQQSLEELWFSLKVNSDFFVSIEDNYSSHVGMGLWIHFLDPSLRKLIIFYAENTQKLGL